MPAYEDSLPTATTEDRTVAIVSYLTFVGFLVAVIMHSNNKTQLGSFHLRQALGLIITGFICWPLNFILAFIPIIGWLAMLAILFTLFVFWVMGFMAALNGQMKSVPIVGALYQKWFANAFT